MSINSLFSREHNQAEKSDDLFCQKLVSIQVLGFACLRCNFETVNENNLRSHIDEKHKNKTGENVYSNF